MFERLEGRTLFALVAPTNVQLTPVGSEQVTVTWTDTNSEETAYIVQRKLSSEPDTAFAPLTGVNGLPADTTRYEDQAGLSVGPTYVYRVLAEKGAEVGPPSATAEITLNNDTTTDLVLGGSATIIPGTGENAPPILQLTGNTPNQLGTAFTATAQTVTSSVDRVITAGTTKINGFTASFDFTVPAKSETPAHGFAFVIQRNGPKAAGAGGDGLGYQGMQDSFAIKFDYYDADFQQNINQTGPYAGGLMDPFGIDTNFDFTSGHTFHVELEYIDALTRLQQRITDVTDDPTNPITYTYTQVQDAEGAVFDLDLDDEVLDGKSAFFGFTGATGDSAALTAAQQITNFKLNGLAVGTPVNPPAATVTNAYVRGANWKAAFNTFLATQSGQDSNIGFKVTGFGATSPILPYSNLDTLALKFSDAVPASLAAGSVTITSAGGKTYTVQSVTTDATDPTLALIKLSSPLLNDRVRVQLTDINAADGNPFDLRLNVLPADVNQSGGAVGAADLVLTRNRIGRTTANPGTGATAYSVFNDVNGDGLINASDLVLVRNNVGKSLPAAPASLFAGASRIAPAARTGLLRELEDLLA